MIPAPTRDQVVPRSHGGPTIWLNLAAACEPCNGRKRHRTPEQAGMPLGIVPFVPTLTDPYSRCLKHGVSLCTDFGRRIHTLLVDGARARPPPAQDPKVDPAALHFTTRVTIAPVICFRAEPSPVAPLLRAASSGAIASLVA